MKHALYRHYDADGRLLYVGITDSLQERQKQHSYASEWADKVAKTEVEYALTRAHAADLERVAIRHEAPMFNKSQKPHVRCVALQADGRHAPDKLIADVLAFIEANGLTRSAAGVLLANDPNLIRDLQNGREVRRAMRQRITDGIDAYDAGAPDQKAAS